mgnify:CR=1 FL=1
MYKLLTNQERVKFLREAADVQRLHVIRTIGEYSNGQHTFNMLAMLRLLWPDAPRHLIWAILEHDIPERVIGDVPSAIRNTPVGDIPAMLPPGLNDQYDYRMDPVPAVGQHSETILEGLGISADKIANLKSSKTI